MISVRTMCACIIFIFFATKSNSTEFELGQVVGKSAIDLSIQAMCKKSVVALGENSHGDGHAMATKVELVKQLIEKCGFNIVLFESSTYEFLPIDRIVHSGQMASQLLLENAVGGLWRYEKEMQPLLSILNKKINAGQIKVGGLDYQIGGLGQPFSNDVLPVELSQKLNADRRILCQDLFRAYIYDTKLPEQIKSEDVAQSERLACLTQMSQVINVTQDYNSQSNQDLIRMYANFATFFKAEAETPQVRLVARAKMMNENANSFIGQQGKNAKVIIWCHSGHAAKSTKLFADYNGADNLGAALKRRFGDKYFAFAITARKGTYRWSKGVEKDLAIIPNGALEAYGEEHGKDTSIFIGPGVLNTLGARPAAMFYHSYQTSDWSQIFDGILILDKEYPPQSTQPGW